MNVDSCDDCKKQGTNKCPHKPHHWCSEHVKKRVCPLPRIGSRDWGWMWNASKGWYSSRHAGYLIGLAGVDGYTVFTWNSEAPPTFKISYGKDFCCLRDAKVLAEARSRRDWKDKNDD